MRIVSEVLDGWWELQTQAYRHPQCYLERAREFNPEMTSIGGALAISYAKGSINIVEILIRYPDRLFCYDTNEAGPNIIESMRTMK